MLRWCFVLALVLAGCQAGNSSTASDTTSSDPSESSGAQTTDGQGSSSTANTSADASTDPSTSASTQGPTTDTSATTAGSGEPTTGSTDDPTQGSTQTGDPSDTDGTDGTEGTDTSETTDATTGDLPPEPFTGLITDENRHHDTMFGGWGPHLRGLMRASDNTLWFPVDAGPDVYTNSAIRYFHQPDDEWVEVTSQPHTAGIQQNAASVMLGDTIYTYGVNISQNFLEECYLNTNTLQKACNAILISNQVYTTPPSSNYVGAAAEQDQTRVVWWTRVGANGGEGDWRYTYNFGGGWNGPVVVPLAGGNDFAYVHAAFTTPGAIALVGQTYYGQYPDGTYGAAVASFSLGQVPTLIELESGELGVAMISSADLWVDRQSGAQHVLARDDQGGVRYYFLPPGEQWQANNLPLHVFASTYRARFVRAQDDLWIARGDPEGGVDMLRVPGADPATAIPWELAESLVISPEGPGFAPPSAIYVESDSYQTMPVTALNLAYCGVYQQADNEIWWATLVSD